MISPTLSSLSGSSHLFTGIAGTVLGRPDISAPNVILPERDLQRGGDPSKGPPRRLHYHLRPVPHLHRAPARGSGHLHLFQVSPGMKPICLMSTLSGLIERGDAFRRLRTFFNYQGWFCKTRTSFATFCRREMEESSGELFCDVISNHSFNAVVLSHRQRRRAVREALLAEIAEEPLHSIGQLDLCVQASEERPKWKLGSDMF